VELTRTLSSCLKHQSCFLERERERGRERGRKGGRERRKTRKKPMAPRSSKCNKKEANRGAWTAEEDQKLAQVIEIHGPKRWRSVAAKAGTLKECINHECL